MGFGPVGFAGVAETETVKHGKQAVFGPAQVVHGIHPGATKVTDRLVGLIRDMHGSEFTGPQQAHELDGVPLVGFAPVAGLAGNEGGSHHRAPHLQTHQHPGNPHAAPAGLIADVDFRHGRTAGFGDLAQRAFESDLGCSHLAVTADFPVAPGSAMAMHVFSLWTSNPM